MNKTPRRSKVTSIVLIGCGNLAWHLAQHLCQFKQLEITVVNHKANVDLDAFKQHFKTAVAVGIENAPQEADYYLLCVSDSAISKVLKKLQINNPKALLVHTSGSTSLSVFEARTQPCAVFYPLQTFSKDSKINWERTPVLIEGAGPLALKAIKQLALQFTENLHLASSKKRLHLHLAAVLVNNFTNALYAAADEHLKVTGHRKAFELLQPIIQTGVEKIATFDPIVVQTGPAKRNDKKTMNKHLVLLKQEKQLKKVYKELSKLIRTQQHGRT